MRRCVRRQISCAAFRSFHTSPACSGRLYTVGGGSFGGLALSSYYDAPHPQRVPVSDPVASVASGWCSNALVTNSGRVYHWGHKPFIRSLTLTAKMRARSKRLLSAVQSLKLGRFTLSNAVTEPELMPEPTNAVAAVCGGDFTAVRTSDGEVWTFGNGFFGQLGHTSYIPHTLLTQPMRIQSLVDDGIHIKTFAAGFHHLALVTSDGHLLTCGKTDTGALGLKVAVEGKRLFQPHHVTLQKPVTAVSCGMKHTVVLCDDGTVYATGFNQFGQLGTNPTFEPTLLFKRVADLDGIKIVSISAGQNHTLFLSDRGDVYACGLNKHGQCGRHGGTLNVSERVKEAVALPCIPLPKLVETRGATGNGLASYGRAQRIVAGFYDSVIITHRGYAMHCGGGMEQTGYQANIEVMKDTADMTVQDVAFGLVHATILAVPRESHQRARVVRQEHSSRPAWFNAPPMHSSPT